MIGRGFLLSVTIAISAIMLSWSPDSRAADRDISVASPSGERRVALIIGNATYKDAPLKNPVNDAKAMAEILREQGFEVIQRVNASKSEMESAIVEFGEKLGEGAVGLVYYSGHGMQVAGKNYLIPVDAQITTEQSVPLRTIDADAVLTQMMAVRSRVNIVILDACRNNPFERRFRAIGGGLAQMNAPEGTLIAYATAPGKVASDGEGVNGLYTQELLRAMRQPNLPIEQVFKRVRGAVSRASGGNQVPWEASSLTGDLFLGGITSQSVSSAPAYIPSFTNEVSEPPEILKMKGDEAYGQSQYEKALLLYIDASKNGLSSAEYMVGVMHEKGRGVGKDCNKALEWYARASSHGHDVNVSAARSRCQ